MLEQARAAENEQRLGISYRLADATTDHLADLADSVDLVLSCYADESRHRGYYRNYDMRLTAATYPPTDGTTISFVVGFGDPGVPPLDVTATWWSSAAYEQAAQAAGFTTVTWRHFSVSETGLARYGAEFWAPYVHRPHAVILEATGLAS